MSIINVRKPIMTNAGHLVRVVNHSLRDCGDRIGFVGKMLVKNKENGNIGELAFSWDNSGNVLSGPDSIILRHWDLTHSSLQVRNVSYEELRQLRG